MKLYIKIDGQSLRGRKAQIFQGRDVAITLLIKDDAGDAVVIDDLDELYIYLSTGGDEVKSFSKAGTGDHQALVKVDTTHYRVDWLSADTSVAAEGEYIMEVNIVESDAAYTDSEKNTIESLPIIDMKSSTVKSESS